MYPQRELIRLAAHKTTVRRNIEHRRAHSTAAAARVLQPLEWLDRMRSFWQRLSPFAQLAAVPLSLLVQHGPYPRLKVLSSLLRGGSLVFGAVRGLTSPKKGRSRLFNPLDPR